MTAISRISDIRYVFFNCFLGDITIAETDDGVCAIVLAKDIKSLKKLFPEADLIRTSLKNSNWARAVAKFIDNPKNGIKIPLVLGGTEFQFQVWNAILKIPFGKTASYKDIAVKIGKPTAARAVANACGANKIPLIIPCHRVVGSNGYIGGYSGAGGVKVKIKLLERETQAGS